MSVKAEASNEAAAQPPAPAATATAPTVVITPPVVIGTVKFDPATNECTLTGKWAMNQADMDSDLDHLRNDCAYVGKGRLPGSFQGHFFMYQRLKAKGKVVTKNTKIVETIHKIAFEGQGANGGGMPIKGEGSNKYGAFTLTGSLSMPEGENEGKFTLFKHYVPKPKKRPAKKNNNARLRGPLGTLQGSDFSAPNMGRRSASDRKRKANSKFKETLNEPEVTLKGPLKKCDKLILVLMKGGDKNKKQMAELFNNPVDLTRFKTYTQDIKPSHPICFMDIKRKLYKGKYKNYDFFANDVRRVFHNAFIFNREEKLGFVYQAAVELSNEFEKKMGKLHNEEVEKARRIALEKAKLEEEMRQKKEEQKQRTAEKKRKEKEKERQRKEREKERKRKQKEKEKEKKRKEKERMKKSSSKSKRKGGRKSLGNLSAKEIEQLMAQNGGVQNQLDMMKQMEFLRNEIAQLKNRGASADGGTSGNSDSTNRKRKKPSASMPKLWDFNAKAELTEKINKLLTHDDAYMDVIMQMIQDYGNIQVDDEEEMELDIDNLNVNCLNELDKFVTKSNKDIRTKNRREREKQRRNERRKRERERKLREQQEEAEQQRMQQRQQQMQMSSNVSMFGNSASNNSSSLLNSGVAPSNTQQNKTAQPQQNTSAPPQKQQQAYVESDEDNDEALASGATGNFDAEFETSGNDNLWSQMGAGSQNAGASKPQPGNGGSNNFEEEEDFDAGF